MSEVQTRFMVRSHRPGFGGALVEAGILVVIGGALALGANHFSPRGLKLARDYFPKSAAPVTAAKTAPLAVDSTAGVPPAVIARLHQKNLQPLGHARVAQLFHDPQYASAIIFVDARDDEHYQAGHIPGAYQFDSYHMEKYLMATLPACLAATNVVVYCNGGDCEDSEFTAITLNQAGMPLDKLFIYAGGFPQWATNGLPVETGDRASGQLKPAKP